MLDPACLIEINKKFPKLIEKKLFTENFIAYLGDLLLGKALLEESEKEILFADVFDLLKQENILLWFLGKFSYINKEQTLNDSQLKIIEAVLQQQHGFCPGPTDITLLIAKLKNEIQMAHPHAIDQLLQILFLFLKNKKCPEQNFSFNKEFKEMVKSLSLLWNSNEKFYAVLSMSVSYGYLSIGELQTLLHSMRSDKDHYLGKDQEFYALSFSWALAEVQNSPTISSFFEAWLSNLFHMQVLSKPDAIPDFELFIKIYNCAVFLEKSNSKILRNLFSFERLVQLKVNGKIFPVQHFCDFILAIGLAKENLTGLKERIKKLLNMVLSKQLMPKSTLRAEIKKYFDDPATQPPITLEQRETLLLLFGLFNEAGTEDIIFYIEAELNNMDIKDDSKPQTPAKPANSKVVNSIFSAHQSQKNQAHATSKRKADNLPDDKTPTKKKATEANEMAHPSSIVLRKPIFKRSVEAFELPKLPSVNNPNNNAENIESNGVASGKKSAGDIRPYHFVAAIEPDDNSLFNAAIFQSTEVFNSHIEKTNSTHNSTKSESTQDDYPNEEELNETEVSNREVGIWGEAALFFNLKLRYIQKYNAVEVKKEGDLYILEGCYQDTEKNKIKGKVGKIRIEVKWFNKPHWEAWRERRRKNPDEKFVDPALQSYDLEVTKVTTKGKRTHKVEVKSTPSNKKATATFSKREFELLRTDPDYRLYRCYGAGTKALFFSKHKEPFRELLEGKTMRVKKVDLKI